VRLTRRSPDDSPPRTARRAIAGGDSIHKVAGRHLRRRPTAPGATALAAEDPAHQWVGEVPLGEVEGVSSARDGFHPLELPHAHVHPIRPQLVEGSVKAPRVHQLSEAWQVVSGQVEQRAIWAVGIPENVAFRHLQEVGVAAGDTSLKLLGHPVRRGHPLAEQGQDARGKPDLGLERAEPVPHHSPATGGRGPRPRGGAGARQGAGCRQMPPPALPRRRGPRTRTPCGRSPRPARGRPPGPYARR